MTDLSVSMGDMLVANPPPLIRENEAFYGYIIGLWVAPSCRDDDLAENTNRAIYAVFEYNSQRTLYRVSGLQSFLSFSPSIYARWLGFAKNTDDYGYNKLWIKKEAERSAGRSCLKGL